MVSVDGLKKALRTSCGYGDNRPTHFALACCITEMTYPESSRSPGHHTNIEPRRGDARRLGSSHTAATPMATRRASVHRRSRRCTLVGAEVERHRLRIRGGDTVAAVWRRGCRRSLTRWRGRSFEASTLKFCRSPMRVFAAGRGRRSSARWRRGRDALRRRGSLDHVSQPEGCRGSAKQQPSPPSESLSLSYVVAGCGG